ncbi:MAG: hypothetical protein H6819_09900 [Phycisphaerales bacterium]|nr:hypothetical protein [Phycisphaerales bacterium]MCB9857961.1 hypothetical protein [Phycisphaerales bacterium]MCB9864946.1 hypothetical protein [Phycisphaerales bacterium]
MSVAILHISGPQNAGKTATAIGFAEFRGKRPTYYLRLDTEREGVPALRLSQPLPVVVEPRRLVTRPGVVFETLAAAVGEIAQQDADATVIVETDNEPCFRHAYPWHARVFCLPPVSEPRVVFRTRDQIAKAVKELMEDTRSFAAEMFGLEHGPGDSSMLPAVESKQILEADTTELLEEFLASEVGSDITFRMRLHTDYYAIMDSDVLVLSESSGAWNGPAAETAGMLRQLLEMSRARLGRNVIPVRCNPNNAQSEPFRACIALIDKAVEAGRQDAL